MMENFQQVLAWTSATGLYSAMLKREEVRIFVGQITKNAERH
jgi:hypothetical protein